MNYIGNRIKHRKILTDFAMNILDKINIPNNIKAFIIKSIHFHTPVNGFIFILLVNFRIAVIIYILFIISLIFFIYFKGCFITIIEYKLDKDNFINIADPYLHINGMEVTNDNRYYVILYIAIVYMVILSWILLYKYYYNY